MLVMSMLKGLHVVKSEELDWLTTFENRLDMIENLVRELEESFNNFYCNQDCKDCLLNYTGERGCDDIREELNKINMHLRRLRIRVLMRQESICEEYLWDREGEKPGVERGCPN